MSIYLNFDSMQRKSYYSHLINLNLVIKWIVAEIFLLIILSTCVIQKLIVTGLCIHAYTWNKESIITCKLATSIGDSKFFSILSSVSNRMGSIALVHIEDICNAHIFLMENDRAQGQYICCVKSCPISEFIDHLKLEYPSSKMQT